jgi:hypothetical protein
VAALATWYAIHGLRVRLAGNVLLFRGSPGRRMPDLVLPAAQLPWGSTPRSTTGASSRWLHGADPWAALVTVNGYAYHYAGSPVTTVLMAPLSLIGEQAFTTAGLV